MRLTRFARCHQIDDHPGFDFWILRDPWDHEFCVPYPNSPGLLARREPWSYEPTTEQSKRQNIMTQEAKR
jgi:hypothetical protein